MKTFGLYTVELIAEKLSRLCLEDELLHQIWCSWSTMYNKTCLFV